MGGLLYSAFRGDVVELQKHCAVRTQRRVVTAESDPHNLSAPEKGTKRFHLLFTPRLFAGFPQDLNTIGIKSISERAGPQV